MTSTAPPVRKLNQQEINAARASALAGGCDPRLGQLAALGASLRGALKGWPIPLLAVQTTYSLLRGTGSVEAWAAALGGLRGPPIEGEKDRRGGNHPSWGVAGGAVAASIQALQTLREAPVTAAPLPTIAHAATTGEPRSVAPGPWAILADQDDLHGLPRAIAQWGRDQVGVGATVHVGEHEVLLISPDARAYAAMCRLLTWRNCELQAWSRWIDGSGSSPDITDLVALVPVEALGVRLRDLGAEVYLRAGARPWQQPATLTIVAAPILRHLDDVDRPAGRVLTAIRERGSVRRDKGASSLALSDLLAMKEAYRGYEDQLERGAELLARCRYVPGGLRPDGQPVMHMPPMLPDTPTENPDEHLRVEAEKGLLRRYGESPLAAARERLTNELRVITLKRFASYVLTVWELSKGKRTCGRGSAASSIVCYCLGLTNVDPVRYKLMFERFLAPERIDPPDIDIDFPWDERDGVLSHTLVRYGFDHVAMVATHQTMHRTAAIREVARAFGLPDSAITQVRDQLNNLDRYGTKVDEMHEPWPAIFRAADAIAGAPRHLGVHCGGVIVTEPPIGELTVVHPATKTVALPDGRIVHMPTVSWEKDGCEDLGFVKIDFLSNRSLAVIRDCIADLTEDGVTIDEHRWRPEEDPATRRIVAAGGTMGCFYIESPAMRQLQAKIGSGDFDRLVVHSSIIRPAANAWINTYIARYHRWKECDGNLTPEEEAEWYPHPALNGLLSESFGVLSYQEDVMLVAQELAGFGSAEANKLRKALGRSDTPERLRSLVGRFHDGCVERGVSAKVIDLVWGMISSFAGYSFCKAHSASYAMVSFQCAWLKAHWTCYFMARVIANEGGYYHASAYVEEARRLGAEIRGPCVLGSEWKTKREGAGAIRLGFHLLKGLTRATADAIERERALRPFLGLQDLKARCRASSEDLRLLNEAGALDHLLACHNSAQRGWLVAVVSRDTDAFIEPATAGGQLVLDLLARDPSDAADPVVPPLRDLDRDAVRRRRFEALGVLPEDHPLTLWRLPRRVHFCRDVTAGMKGKRMAIIAWCITRKQVSATYLTDENGETLDHPRYEAMSFVTMEDETGLIETVWFPETYRRYGVLLERHEPLRLIGRVDVTFGNVTVTAEQVELVQLSGRS